MTTKNKKYFLYIKISNLCTLFLDNKYNKRIDHNDIDLIK